MVRSPARDTPGRNGDGPQGNGPSRVEMGAASVALLSMRIIYDITSCTLSI
jgi:hypothetical protein